MLKHTAIALAIFSALTGACAAALIYLLIYLPRLPAGRAWIMKDGVPVAVDIVGGYKWSPSKVDLWMPDGSTMTVRYVLEFDEND